MILSIVFQVIEDIYGEIQMRFSCYFLQVKPVYSGFGDWISCSKSCSCKDLSGEMEGDFNSDKNPLHQIRFISCSECYEGGKFT